MPMARDRMQPLEFLLTQEFMAMMLGVQRTGLIRYKHGNVTVIDRHGLTLCSCEHYGASKKEFDRLLGDPARSGRSPART
jgi:hypothetical protein